MFTPSPKMQRRLGIAKPPNPGVQRNASPKWDVGTSDLTALLTEVDVSRVLQVSLATLRKWRVDQRGPRFIKIGSLVRYQLEDLHEWLSSLPTGGIASPPVGEKAGT